MRHDTGNLDQLTSLRFFAALMVLVYHSLGLFGLPRIDAQLGQGVSFFFVLSGFILTYVYPRLESAAETRRFLRARIARIWPAHVATLLLGFVLVPYVWDTPLAVANLLMLQGWIPMSSYYFSYNSVSWSISTELFFYLAFPFLVSRWDTTWSLKLLASLLLVVVLVVAANHLALPLYGNRGHGSDGRLVTQHGLIYIGPLGRLFEFVLGMSLARAWRVAVKPVRSTAVATSRELAAIGICALTMVYAPRVAQWSRDFALLGPSIAVWLENSGSALSFGLLIYVIAQGGGRVSRALCHPALVLLGEISYSFYLLHQILLNLYRRSLSVHLDAWGYATFAGFVLFVVLASYLMWVCVEMPARRLLLGRVAIHGTPAMLRSWRAALALGRRPALAAVVLLAIVCWVRFGLDRSEPGARPDAHPVPVSAVIRAS